MDTLQVVDVSLRGGKKNRATFIARITCLWDIRDNKIMIERKHTGPYDPRIRSNKVDYSMFVGPYFTTYDVKVLFHMPEFLAAR